MRKWTENQQCEVRVDALSFTTRHHDEDPPTRFFCGLWTQWVQEGVYIDHDGWMLLLGRLLARK
jgi:hypothetical protein